MSPRRLLFRALGLAACASVVPRVGSAQGVPPLVFHAELGGGAVLTAPQQRQLGLLGSFEGALRVGVRLHPAVSVRLSGSYWGYPARTDRGADTLFGAGSVQAGVRLDPAIRTIGRLWLDLDVGVGFTGTRPVQARPAGGVGVGFDLRVTPSFALGPFVRVETLVPMPGNDQLAAPITLVGGVAFTLEPTFHRAPPPAPPLPPPPAAAPPPPAPAAPPAPTDTDHDGVDDPTDLCPTDPAGERPDPARSGCPQRDGDGDGVLDAEDQCPSEPAGARVDPARAGCPLPDLDPDGDGVPLPTDRCPDQPETRNQFEDEDGCPDTPPPVQLAGERITVNGTILFQTDRDRILPESFALLDQVATILQAHSEIRRVRIEGHTDDQGNARRNRALSRRRANAVERYLRDHGIDRDRLTSEGYGAERRIATGSTEEDHARNRRVEFYIVDPPGGVSATAAATPPAAPTAEAPPREGHHRRDHHRRGRRHRRRDRD